MPLKNTATNKPQEIAAIDLGSNSFHMVIARVVNGALQVLGRLKQRVHLADGLDSNNVLSEEAIERGLACLALFAERLQGFPADNVTIVGTHTLRQAVNAEVFLKRAAKVIPYPIEIIPGNEEARLIFMGVEHTQPERGRKLVIDIGGTHTRLARATSGSQGVTLDAVTQVATPTDATALAALIAQRERFAGQTVVVVASGGNVDASVMAEVLGGAGPA